MSALLKNKWLSGALLLVVLATGYYFFFAGSGSTAELTPTSPTSPLSQEILVTLSQLHTIQLDPAIFEDAVFASLTDFGVTIPPQQAGRRNPFAPVGSDGGAASAQTTSAAPATTQTTTKTTTQTKLTTPPVPPTKPAGQ